MSKFLELQIKLLEKERVELREEIIKLKAENKKQLTSTDVSKSVAKEYAEFCVRCDREGLPLIELDSYIKQTIVANNE